MNFNEFAPDIKLTLKDIKNKLTSKGCECEEITYYYQERLEVGRGILINWGTAEAVIESLDGEEPMG